MVTVLNSVPFPSDVSQSCKLPNLLKKSHLALVKTLLQCFKEADVDGFFTQRQKSF